MMWKNKETELLITFSLNYACLASSSLAADFGQAPFDKPPLPLLLRRKKKRKKTKAQALEKRQTPPHKLTSTYPQLAACPRLSDRGGLECADTADTTPSQSRKEGPSTCLLFWHCFYVSRAYFMLVCFWSVKWGDVFVCQIRWRGIFQQITRRQELFFPRVSTTSKKEQKLRLARSKFINTATITSLTRAL